MFLKEWRDRRDYERRWLTTEARSRIALRRHLTAMGWAATIGALAAVAYAITRL